MCEDCNIFFTIKDFLLLIEADCVPSYTSTNTSKIEIITRYIKRRDRTRATQKKLININEKRKHRHSQTPTHVSRVHESSQLDEVQEIITNNNFRSDLVAVLEEAIDVHVSRRVVDFSS